MKFKNDLQDKIAPISQNKYGKYAEKLKKYSIFQEILHRVFVLIQEDPKNM